WEDFRYIGYQDYVALNCWDKAPSTFEKLIISGDTGTTLNIFSGVSGAAGYSGHYDFSPDGKLAHSTESGGVITIRTKNIDGTGDTVHYTGPNANEDSRHITWPRAVNGWFVVGFFPAQDRKSA